MGSVLSRGGGRDRDYENYDPPKQEKKMVGGMSPVADIPEPPKWTPQLSIAIPIPREVEPYAEDIRRFVHAMIYKLKVHHKKGKWEDLKIGDAVHRLDEECGELRDAVEGGNLMEIMNESADVANFALIIASIAVERGK